MKLYQTAVAAVAFLLLAFPASSQETLTTKIHKGLVKTFQADFPPKENPKSQSKEKLAEDPRVLHGTTANGLSYYIVKNSAKKGYADFYLVQKGGMAVEDTSEAGITRFLQDMSLRGTRNFPGSSMVKFLERQGAVPDRGIRVETYENGSVTGMTDIPVGRNQAIADSCLLILYNWSYSLNLDDEDVDLERNYRAERIKVADSPERRLAVKSAAATFPGGAFSRQNPDTQLSDLRGFTPKRLRNYYYRWFTPDKQALVICGDVDQAKVENYIRTLFSTIPKPADTPSLLYATIPPKDTVQFLILADPKLQYCEVSLTMQAELLNADLRLTGVSLISDYMNSLCCSIFEKRLKESAQNVDFPVYDISVGYGPFFKSPMADDGLPRITSNREALTIKVRTNPEDVYSALDFIIHETERVDRYGFSTSEYQYANSQYWKRLNRQYYFRKSLSTNGYYSDMCISNFLNGTSLASIELKHLYMSKINVPDTLYSSQINSFIRLLDNPERDALITISLPDSVGAPDHDRLVGTYVTALASPCDTTHDVNADSLLFKLNLPTQKQAVVKESIEPSTGATVWTLPNGATVVCKNSDTTRGRFLFRAFGKGGSSLAEGTAAKWRQRLGDLTPICRVCGYDAFDMDMLMAGKDVEFVSGMNVYSEYLSGEGSSDGLDAFMRLMYMNFTSRTEDTTAFKAYARNNGVPMTISDYRECFDFISSRFSNASNFIFIFVGDLDLVKLKALSETYIATLPSNGSRSNWKALPTETFSATDRVGRIVYKSSSPYGKENYLLFNVTRRIIDSYLCSRFAPSGALVSAGGDCYFYPSGYSLLQVDYKTSGDSDSLRTAIRSSLADLAEKGVDPTLFRNTVSSLAAEPRYAVKDNDYWMTVLTDRYLVGKAIYPYFEEQLPNLAKPQVDLFLKQLITEDNAK